LANPSNYPIKDLEGRIPLRSLKGLNLPENLRIVLISSVQFGKAPMNTKLTDEVHLNSLGEGEFHSSLEYRLTENATVILSEALSLEYEEVIDLQASLDGKNVNCKVTEYEGKKYYVVPELNLTKIDEIRKFEMSFKYKIVVHQASHVRIPLLFNENYAQYNNFPLTIIQVQENTTSDLCTFRVRFNLPLRRILVEQSGWKDAFVPSESEWILVNPENGTYQYPMFEYPISQEFTINENTYSFKTYFSKQNVANAPSVTLIPDIKIPILMLLFLFSPIYVPFFAWLHEIYNVKSTKKGTKLKAENIKRFLLIIFKLYSIPLGIAVIFGVSSESLLSMLQYIYEIMNPAVLVLVLAYPAFFSLVYYKWKGRI